MAVHDPTAANVSLWARYLEDEWGAALDPRGRPAVHAAAAAVAGWLAVAMAPRIERMYRENVPHVNAFVADAAAEDEPEVPAMLRRDARRDRAQEDPALDRIREAVYER